jgi:hypothetical protein
MANQWFKNAVIYCIDVDTFKDGNGDGVGDFVGLRQGLSSLAGLGVTCIWLLPFYPLPAEIMVMMLRITWVCIQKRKKDSQQKAAQKSAATVLENAVRLPGH